MNAMMSGVRNPARPLPKLRFTRRFDKIVELLVYLAAKKPHRDQYQAVKLFYLADKEHFNRFGRPITFETYYALDYGPVASTVLDLIKGDRHTLRAANLERLPITVERRDRIYSLERAERSPDYDIFSKSDLKVFDEIVDEYGDSSFDALYRLTHEHFAYKAAWDSRAVGEHRALMFYEDMIDEGPNKSDLVEELEPVAAYMR